MVVAATYSQRTIGGYFSFLLTTLSVLITIALRVSGKDNTVNENGKQKRETCIVLHLTHNILLLNVIINGARSVLQIRSAMASRRLPGPFVRFITHRVTLALKYKYMKKYTYVYYIMLYIDNINGIFVINILLDFKNYTLRGGYKDTY